MPKAARRGSVLYLLVGAAGLVISTSAVAETSQSGPMSGGAQSAVMITVGVPIGQVAVRVGGDDASSHVTVGTGAPHGMISVSRASDALGAPVGEPVRISSRRAQLGPPSGRPLAYGALTSGFGWRQHPILGTLRAHAGIDLAAPSGTPIQATSDGVVSFAQYAGGYGLLVVLDHGAGVQTRYGHMSRSNVLAGQRVRRGEVIGFVGSTGRSTGPHVHYELRRNGAAVDPLNQRKN